jgi:hypothetical protein
MTMLLRALQFVGWCSVIAVALVVAVAFSHSSAPSEHPVVEYKDFVSILLTAIAVMIGIGAVIAAFAAIWGFDLLRKEMTKIAADAAADVATKRVDEIVPGLVEQSLKVDRQVTGKDADEIAKVIGE